MKNDSYDEIDDLIRKLSGNSNVLSEKNLLEAMRWFSSLRDGEKENNTWIIRYRSLESFKLDANRDGSETYYRALKDALIAITIGDYGSLEYKGYKIYYSDTPVLSGISLGDGREKYRYQLGFHCDALSVEYYEEYNSDEERKAYIDPENELFDKTLELLDREIEALDEGIWIKEKKKLSIYDFKDYEGDNSRFKKIEWDDMEKDASETFTHLMNDAHMRSKDLPFTEADFEIFADVIRLMIFYADYGKRVSRCDLERFVLYEWKPKSERNCYIWQCMDLFDVYCIPDDLLDGCAIYYFIYDPQGWEAVACTIPILVLWKMCLDYDPDDLKNQILKYFDFIPGDGYRERIEMLIETDRTKAKCGGAEDD